VTQLLEKSADALAIALQTNDANMNPVGSTNWKTSPSREVSAARSGPPETP